MGSKSSRPRSASTSATASQPGNMPNAMAAARAAQRNRAIAAGGRQRSATMGASAGPSVYPESSFLKLSPSHRPSGVTYPFKLCRWNPEVLAQMVSKREIAPFAKGCDDPVSPVGQQMEECPLCMLYYSTGLNECAVCNQGMCSECLACLIHPPSRTGGGGDASKCPFCNASPFRPIFRGPKSVEELRRMQEEANATLKLERAQLDVAVEEEATRLQRKRDGLSPPISPAAKPCLGARALTPPSVPTLDDDLYELPYEIRRAILQEELRQHLVTYCRFKLPDRIGLIDEIVKRYGADKHAEVMAAIIAKNGPPPSLDDMRRDIVDRLMALYRSKGATTMTRDEAMSTVLRFEDAPWKAMARAVVERGRETQPLPPPQGHSTSVDDAAYAADILGALQPTQSSSAIDPALLARLSNEAHRQVIISLLRLTRPALLRAVANAFDARPDTRLTEVHLAEVMTECGVSRDAINVASRINQDVLIRIKWYLERVPAVARSEADIEALLQRHQHAEPFIMAGLVLLYGPEPPDCPLPSEPLPTTAPQHDENTSCAIVRALLVSEDLDGELAAALRCSVASL